MKPHRALDVPPILKATVNAASRWHRGEGTLTRTIAAYTANVPAGASVTSDAFESGSAGNLLINVFVVADKPGTLIVEASDDKQTFVELTPVATVADTGLPVVVAMLWRYYRVRFSNEGTTGARLRMGIAITPRKTP